MIAQLRKLVNPPYSVVDMFTLIGLVLILLTVPVITLNVPNVREPVSKAAQSPPCQGYGDTDLDGDVDINDARHIINHVAGVQTSKTPFNPQQLKNAEVDGDDQVTSADSTKIVRFVVGGDITFYSCADPDGDGFSNAVEDYLGTDPYDSCSDSASNDAWPPDLWRAQSSLGKVSIQDITSFIGPIRRLDTKKGDANFNPRWDINRDGLIKHDDSDRSDSDIWAIRPYLNTSCSNATPKPALTFTANNADSVTLNRGEQVTLRWSTTNAGSPCKASGGWGGLINNSGETGFSVDSPKTFSLRCGGSNGMVEKSVAVTVRPCTGILTISVDGDPTGNIDKNPGQSFSVEGSGLSSCSSSDKLILQDWDWPSTTWVNTSSSCSLNNGSSCSLSHSFQSGYHAVRLALDLDSNGIERGSDFLYINVVNQEPPPPTVTCTGSPVLYLSQRTVQSGGGAKITATSNGFANCGKGDIQFFWIRPVTRDFIESDYITQCNFEANPTECSGTFDQPNDVGRYEVAVTYQLAGGGALQDVEYLDVLAPPPVTPIPTPTPIGSADKDIIKNFIREYVGGVNVPKIIRTGWGSEVTVNMGEFLFGLSGCESGWDSRAFNTGYYKEKGLFQYQARNIPGYENSPGDTWGSAVARTQELGFNFGGDVWNFEDQVRVTEWKVKKGGGENVNAWSCFTGGGWVEKAVEWW